MKTEAQKQIDVLNNKIELLKSKHKIESDILTKLENIKFSFIGDDKKTGFLSCEPKDKSELIKILKSFKPSKENRIVKTCSNSHEIKSPFKIELINPCSISRFSDFELRIVYKCLSGFDVWVKFPIDEIKEFLKPSRRNITSSEYHYFIGVSQRQLNEMTVKMYLFDVERGNYLSMYGGNQYLLDVEMINKIIHKLTK